MTEIESEKINLSNKNEESLTENNNKKNEKDDKSKQISNDDSLNKEKKKEDDGVFCVPALPPTLPPPPQLLEHPSSDVREKTRQSLAKAPILNYEVPKWSSKPPSPNGESQLDEEGFCAHYYLEVIKNGVVVDKIKLDKEFLTLGRFELCDILCEHPSLSRYHAVLQYSNGEVDSSFPQGFYLYDLNSAHGTFLNKARLNPNEFVRFNLESIAKFGMSTRIYVLHGPKPLNSADDLKINLTHEQMKEVKDKYSRIAMKLKIRKELEEEEIERARKGKSVDWGLLDEEERMNEENSDEENYKNPFAVEESDESYFSSDPKKALKTYFEREGEELEYECEQASFGKFKCRIRLPLLDQNGEEVCVEVVHEGKKKECVAQCALEACRLLNAEGVLKQSSGAESAKKKREKDWESADFYDSDDDTYLDRTGDVEKKRFQRMAQAGKLDEKTARSVPGLARNKVHTFDSLLADLKTFLTEKSEIVKKLETCKSVIKAVEEDDLDSYIESLKVSSVDTVSRAKMKRRLVELNAELNRVDKLMRVAKPSGFDLEKWKSDFNDGLNNKISIEPIQEKKNVQVNKEEIEPEIVERKNVERESVEKSNEQTEKKREIKKKKYERTNLEKKEEEEKAEKEAENEEESQIASKAKKFKHKKAEENENVDVYESNPQDYYTWLPPQNQSGDGKTKLNEKFGY